MGRNTRLRLVFLPTLLSCSSGIPTCFITEQSTVKASLFVKYIYIYIYIYRFIYIYIYIYLYIYIYVFIYIYITEYHRLEEITPLVTGVKSIIYKYH